MSTNHYGLALVLLALGGFAYGQPIMDGSAADPLYGSPLIEQDTQTSMGDSYLGEPDIAPGSELDALYSAVYGDTLYLVLAGNFNTDFGDRLVLFFDTLPGQGQSTLLGPENPEIDFRALQRMGTSDPNNPDMWGPPGPGLTFPTGFAPDYFVSFKCFGLPTKVHVNYARLYVDPNDPGEAYYLGAGSSRCSTSDGVLSGADLGAPFFAKCALDNSNVAGVTYGIDYETPADPVLTGIEFAIPLSALGNPSGDLELLAFITSSRVDYISNQMLGGLGGALEPGEPRGTMLGLFGGATPVTVSLYPLLSGACCLGSNCLQSDPTTCAGSGGVYLGDNVPCDGNPCDGTPAGRCCFDNGYAGECHVTDATECASLGGVFEEGENCDGCPCLIPAPGACCVESDCYDFMLEEDCTMYGGVFLGRYSDCSWGPCVQGACCEDTVCTERPRHECYSVGGEFIGEYVECETGLCDQFILHPYLAGGFNGWNPASDPMAYIAPGVHELTLYSLDPNSLRQEFKVTNGTWERALPPANSWLYADPNGTITVQYDARTHQDGWLPDHDRLILSSAPGPWAAVGDWNAWNPSDPNALMSEVAPSVYEITLGGLSPGHYNWKPTLFGTWDAISQDGRTIDGPAFSFEIDGDNDFVILRADALAGVAQAVVVHDCNANGVDDAEDAALCSGQPWCSDCNKNGVLDTCDIADGTSQDVNTDGIPDECYSIGACCLVDVCLVTLAQQCTALGGDYQGDGSDCTTCPCGQPCDPFLVDGVRDAQYGAPLAIQDTQTSFGDSNLGLVDAANGSELDAAYGRLTDNRLHLLLTGNLESNYNKLELFFDTRPGGQQRILHDNPVIDDGALQRLGDAGIGDGLTLDPNFAADFWIGLSGGDTPYTLYVNYAELYVNEGNTGFAQFLGEGAAADRSWDGLVVGNNPEVLLATIDNSNTLGVDGGTELIDLVGVYPEDVTTGIELSIPLTLLDSPSGACRVVALLNAPAHDHLSNQVLGALGGGDSLGEPRTTDLGTIAGLQYFVVTSGILGDLNCDNLINNGDIDPFVLALTNPSLYDTTYPNCDRDLADCNDDGLVNNGDIDAFVALLSGD